MSRPSPQPHSANDWDLGAPWHLPAEGWRQPPPGTLGYTYRRRSRLLDKKELHPRAGVVEVRLPEHADVTSGGMKSTWTGEVWRLETEEPLLPGVPHIFAIQAVWTEHGIKQKEVRWIRLIMGRIVDLDFDTPVNSVAKSAPARQ